MMSPVLQVRNAPVLQACEGLAQYLSVEESMSDTRKSMRTLKG